MKRTKMEQETIILFNEAEGTAEITVYAPRLKRRLAELARERPGECHLKLEDRDGSADYTFPKSWMKINPSRVLTDEQRQAAADNLRKALS